MRVRTLIVTVILVFAVVYFLSTGVAAIFNALGLTSMAWIIMRIALSVVTGWFVGRAGGDIAVAYDRNRKVRLEKETNDPFKEAAAEQTETVPDPTTDSHRTYL